jgi:hypothetical protein
VCWLLTAFFGPPTDRRTLIAFYHKIRPYGPGWERIRREAGLSETKAGTTRESIPLALLGWSTGCAMIWSSLFVVGNVLYGRFTQAGILLAVFIASGLVLLRVIRTLWMNRPLSP